MKTLEISDELYEKLKYLSDEIKNQNNRGTADPYFYQILTYDKIPTDSNYEDESKWISYEDCFSVENTADAMKQYILDNEKECEDVIKEYLEYWCYDNFDYTDEDALEEVFKNLGFEKISYKLVPRYENCFLTEKSIKEHIRLNGYHYEEPKDYMSYAFRNPDMDTIFKFLREIEF